MFSCKHREKHVCNLCCADSHVILISCHGLKILNLFFLLLLRKQIWSWNFNFNFFQILVFWGGSPPLPEKRFWEIENKLRFWSDLIIKITTPIIFLIELWPSFIFNYFSVCHLHNSQQKIHTSSPLPIFSNFTLCLICLIMISTNIANMLLSFCQ